MSGVGGRRVHADASRRADVDAEGTGAPAAGAAPAPHVPRRIHIVGGEATGKTTIARRVGTLLDLPITNLDAVAWRAEEEGPFEVWDPQYQPSTAVILRPLEERVAIARELAGREGWVTEGKHLGWTDPLFERAEVIVWLDHVGPAKALLRILLRAMRSAVREAGRRQGREKFARFQEYATHGRELLGQLWRRVRYGTTASPGAAADGDDPDAVTRADIETTVSAHGDRLVHVRRDEDLDRLIARLASGVPVR